MLTMISCIDRFRKKSGGITSKMKEKFFYYNHWPTHSYAYERISFGNCLLIYNKFVDTYSYRITFKVWDFHRIIATDLCSKYLRKYTFKEKRASCYSCHHTHKTIRVNALFIQCAFLSKGSQHTKWDSGWLRWMSRYL